MKKFSVIAVAMTATLALGACSSDEEPEEPTTAEQTTEDTTSDTGTETGDTGAETGDTGAETGDTGAETGDTGTETGDAGAETGDAASFSEPACQEFFTEGGPMADRAEAGRLAIDNGEIVDTVTMSEVTLLKSRLDATAKDAPEDISALILEVNAPFAAAQDAVNEASEDVIDPETGAITLPEIDTQASADAQAELETACAG
ncbi:hypothetical protein FNH13_02395 [Ornithinimicrobium ciconiae]|uniref:Uncharacterized protein n=1 Tax=Ornithinimicrobium ciconiae TaxID=2594265 RepID=A0A516G726_9MICO|nr:hypothetical protein [Ornithinimicrobium ciconiae]QDO87323.1 hypothetical protein FNH13_02395 [Ornithinimicrobium ciconiae]